MEMSIFLGGGPWVVIDKKTERGGQNYRDKLRGRASISRRPPNMGTKARGCNSHTQDGGHRAGSTITQRCCAHSQAGTTPSPVGRVYGSPTKETPFEPTES